MTLPDVTPYCGSAPVPGSVIWNLDPVLIVCLAAIASAHLTTGLTPSCRPRVAALGWAVLAVALVSPLCNLSVALFSARVGQHMITTLIAAPLVGPRISNAAGSA
jgi:putative membrane protein